METRGLDATVAAFPARARELAPLIAEHAAAADRLGRLAQPVVDALRRAGFFGMLVPRHLGGGEVEPAVAVETVEELSRADGSVGWCVAAGALNGQFASVLPPAGVAEIWGADPATPVCVVTAPRARATPVDGGYRVTGRWRFASGCEFSTWLGGAGLVEGLADERVWLFLPMSECRIVEGWDVTGLRATASHDVAVDDVFVPAHFVCAFAERPHESGPLYATCEENVAPMLAAVPLGVARAGLDAVAGVIGQKRTAEDTPLRDSPLAQARFAEAEARLRAARALLYQAVDETWGMACQRGELTEVQRSDLRLAAVHSAREGVAALDQARSIVGTSAIFTASPLERAFRDVHTATQNAALSASFFATAGRRLLEGIDSST